MKARSLGEVASAVGGVVRAADPSAVVSSVVTDGRSAAPGSLFVALRGERVDGHAFVGQAMQAGAIAAVVREPVEGPHVEVDDTALSLLALARDEREHMPLVRVIAITGANGKTSTKDLAAAVLSGRYRTHASPASFNNEIGLPMTLLGAPPDVEVIVAEMGARRVGDVALLCDVARPDVAVVTNVGVAHMEIFGSWERIVAASAEPLETLGSDGVAIVNADDIVVRELASRTRGRTIRFALDASADVRAERVELDARGRASFTLVHGDDREPLALAVAGEHMVSNALAAAACGLALDLSLAECAAGLKGARIAPWRMETSTTAGGVLVVNDAYNANPESMAAALKAARWMARDGRLVAVLGHMAELGPIAREEHDRLGELIVRVGVDRLVTVGDEARAIARAAVREGQPTENAEAVADAAGAAAAVRAWARAGDVVLIKGSRVVGLERVAEALR
ncbi:MAG TPA: UDP-N-acetylmuramoyl-tripeptide--D-alanyl-D-alanine ligase [Actinomycetota bacterium]